MRYGFAKAGFKGVVWRGVAGIAVGTVGLATVAPITAGTAQASNTAQYIVADNAGLGPGPALSLVASVGGLVLTTLNSANGVLAQLSPWEASLLSEIPTVTVTLNSAVAMSGQMTTLSGAPPAAVFPQQSGATQLWSQKHTGSGVAVAVLDTGIDPLPDFAGRLLPGVDLSGGNNPYQDRYGHGTFVAGLVAGNGATSGGKYMGEAPGANLVSVKVAGANGETSLGTIIEGIDWVIAHRQAENIGVMNLSLGYFSGQSTVVNPLDQAVERAWEAGIVVVVSAGNNGPSNGTVLSPGDDPLVITAGAVNDHGSTSTSGDTMASFSASGPTDPDGWFKPDLVTSGTSVVSLMAPGSTVATSYPGSEVGTGNFVGSGTSFSSAITAGAAALLLSDHKGLQPDVVKAALLGDTSPGPVGDPFVDGHGLLNVAAAATGAGLRLREGGGQLEAQAGDPGNLSILPGQTVKAGYALSGGSALIPSTAYVTGGELSLPVACKAGGSEVGAVQVDVPAVSQLLVFTAGPAMTVSELQGSAAAPDLCAGAPMYAVPGSQPAMFTGNLVSTDILDSVKVQFGYSVGTTLTPLPPQKAVPVALTQEGSTVQLGSTFLGSTWNPKLWSGLKNPSSPVSSATTNTSWDGAAWNGAAWNGHAWNGAAWNGHAWNGAAWN